MFSLRWSTLKRIKKKSCSSLKCKHVSQLHPPFCRRPSTTIRRYNNFRPIQFYVPQTIARVAKPSKRCANKSPATHCCTACSRRTPNRSSVRWEVNIWAWVLQLAHLNAANDMLRLMQIQVHIRSPTIVATANASIRCRTSKVAPRTVDYCSASRRAQTSRAPRVPVSGLFFFRFY